MWLGAIRYRGLKELRNGASHLMLQNGSAMHTGDSFMHADLKVVLQ